MNDSERFWARVDVRGPDECWPWDRPGTDGYGRFGMDRHQVQAHRYAYELRVGPIPEGMTLDHTCHTRDAVCSGGDRCPHRGCCNPAHLEPVSSGANVMRGRGIAPTNAAKTHCTHGHEFTPENTRWRKTRSGIGRDCNACHREAFPTKGVRHPMITFNDDGSVSIDFPDPTGLVRIRPPKYGAYRRLQHERQREIDAMNQKVAALPTLDPIPQDAPDATPEQIETNRIERQRLTPMYQARVLEVQDFAADALGNIWRLMLIGSSGPDGDFAPLADPIPPDDRDEWPVEMLVDVGDLSMNAAGEVIRTNPTLLDSVFRHMGKFRSRSGPTALLPTT